MEFDKSCSCMGKSLDHFLQATILYLLKQEETHGFVLIQKISETPMFEGNYPDPSGLYRYLKKMQQQGLLLVREEEQEDFPAKRIYSISEHGEKCLQNWVKTIAEYTVQLEKLMQMIGNVME